MPLGNAITPGPAGWFRVELPILWVGNSLGWRSAAHNFGRRLKTLNGLTPYEYIFRI